MKVAAAVLAAALAAAILSEPRWLGAGRPVPLWLRAAGVGLAAAAGAGLFGGGDVLAGVAAFAALMGAVADGVDRVIPHRWVALLAAAGIGRMAAGSLAWLPAVVLGAAFGAFFLVLYILLRGGLGLGDVKLAMAMGIGLGWPLGLDAMVYGLVAGGLVGAGLLALGKARARDSIAFGPFLAFGVLVALLVHPG